MAAVWNRAGHYIFILWVSSSFYSPILSCRMQIGCLPYFHTWCDFSANLECRSEMCRTRLAENTERKKSPKIRHLCTIAQLCWAISSQRRHCIDNRNKLVKQQYVPHMFLQYGSFGPLTAEIDRIRQFGAPNKFQRVSRLCFVIAPTLCN